MNGLCECDCVCACLCACVRVCLSVCVFGWLVVRLFVYLAGCVLAVFDNCVCCVNACVWLRVCSFA